MALMDYIQSAVEKITPSKRSGSIPGKGIGAGIVQYDDEMIVSKPAIILHALQIFFNFLAMCCFASLASFQAHWKIGPSGLSSLSVFISVMGIIFPLVLMLIPVLSEKYDRLTRLARGMAEVRVGFILVGAGATVSLLISFITTISAFTQKGCKNPDNDPHADLGDEFKNGLRGFCTTKKAGAIFFWFAFFAWAGSLALNIMYWRKNKRTGPRDPPFEPPTGYNPPTRQDSGAGATQGRAPSTADVEEDDEEESLYEQVPRPRPGASPTDSSNTLNSPFADTAASQPRPYSGYSSGAGVSASRPSTDAYGAFSDPAPSGFAAASGLESAGQSGVSRTMQYADPYAAIRSSIASSGANSAGGAPGYGAGPPSYEYTGYRPR